MKNIDEFLKVGTPQSMMRLSLNRMVKTSIFVAILVTTCGGIGFIVGVILDREMESLAACIGALAGLGAAIIGALNIPAFGGKAIQAFPENKAAIVPDLQERAK